MFLALAGGVRFHTLPIIQHPAFLQRFKRKGRFAELMGRITMHVVVTPAGLAGAPPAALEGEVSLKSINVTAQVGFPAHDRRRDFAKLDGSQVRASMMFQPCFLAVEKKDRMSAKSIAPLAERKPPGIFCRSFIMRPSRSA